MIYLILGLALGVILCFIILLPKLKQTQEIDNEIKNQNQILSNEVGTLVNKKEQLLLEIEKLQNMSANTYQEQERVLKEKFEENAERLGLSYQQAEQEYQNEFLDILSENVNYFTSQIESKRLELIDIDNKLQELKSKSDAAVEIYKRAMEDELQHSFYKIELSDEDIREIKKLKEVAPFLRDPHPLNKVIWSVYYEHPYTDLVGRVIGNGIHTGIYKITNLENHMCYVGQAVNIADRWKQHIKCAIGADDAPRNKLYPAMEKYGVENFTFEIIEECSRDVLNEREQYWQEFYKAKEFGYSIH